MSNKDAESTFFADMDIRCRGRRSADTLPLDLGLQYVRTLSETDLDRMIRANKPDLPVNEVPELQASRPGRGGERRVRARLHRHGGLLHGRPPRSDRALRNARLLTEFTGHRAIPVVASVRNVNEVSVLVESGDIYWYELEERYTATG